MTETTTPTPDTFSFSDWFGDANLPEASADIFTNAGVLSDLSELQRRMDVEVRVDDAERTAGSKAAKRTLEDEYVELAKKFTDSKVTVYVRALPSTERIEIRAAHDKAQKEDGEQDRGFVFRSLAASIVALKRADGKRVPVTLTYKQVEDLFNLVGDAQIQSIQNAQLTATNAMPTVDADFLRKLSGPAAGPES
jgi:hypothetical protein